ncbi:MAG TPA: protein translocase subunit SecD [Solirubrobacteraceae bacterium]|nr:protein translocase subunit SecD [Solirubrobacteraceae bacterium]
MSDRRRYSFILLLVAGLLIASGLAIASKPTRLGLDLKGGVELIYQGKPTPQQPNVTDEAMARAIDIVRQRVDQLGVAEPEIQRAGKDLLIVSLPAVKSAGRAIDQVGKTAQLFFYDWEPNVLGPNGKPAPNDPQVTGGSRAGEGGVPQYQAVLLAAKRPPTTTPQTKPTTNGEYYLVNDRQHRVRAGPEESARNLLADIPRGRQPGDRVVHVNRGTVVVQAEDRRPKAVQRKAPLDQYFVLNDAPVLKGTDISNPAQNFESPGGAGNGPPDVTFDFASGRARNAFHKVTRAIAVRGAAQQLPGQSPQNAFQHFAIVLDNQLVSVPYIDYTQNPDGIDATNGSQISGGFTIQSAQDLANLLKTGALPIKLKLISQSQVSATLGKQALNQGLIAGVAGLALVMLFLLLFYRVLGLIASGTLIVYSLYFYALIKLIPITMTLPGIAGLILTIGVAADANVVIFERVKEEVRAGRSIAAGIAAGYKKGLTAILDANVVTLMAAFILFVLATAGVKGFAFTLGVGTIVSLFTAVVATNAILATLGRSRLISSRSALGAGERRRLWSRFDFMGASRYFFSMSGVILLVGALAVGGKGLNLGIDFKSGSQIKVGLQRPATESQVRSVFAAAGNNDAKIQKVKDKAVGPNAFQISTRTLQPNKVQAIRAQLENRFGIGQRGAAFANRSIGPTFGKTVANSAVVAIIASLLVISAYIALRFEWKYAVPVLIALMHDLLITSGVYSLTGREVTTSTVAALLTILGYSLYDTIIVFDRVRENVPRMPRAAFSQIVNRSMSEVLTRSLATTFCTLLPIASLLLFGGATLKDFAFALLVGVASGAYSSVFIASPVLTHWKEREPVYAHRAARIRRESGGLVPAYAVATADAPIDVEPKTSTRRRRGRLTAPEQPDEIAPKEFEELVRDLHGDGEQPKAKPEVPAREAASETDAVAERIGLRASTPTSPPTGGSATPTSRPAKPKGDKPKRPRNRRHGRNR